MNRIYNRFLETIVALGLVLFPVDNYYLGLQYGIRIKDVGLVLIICGCIGIILKTRNFNSNKWINLCICIIAGAICIDAIVRGNGYYKIYNVVLTLSFILIYFASLSKFNIVRLFPYAVLIQAISCIIQGLMYFNNLRPELGYFVGGIVTTQSHVIGNETVANYNLACGYMAFGFILSSDKWKRILLPVIILATFFTGSIEGIYIVTGLFIWMIIKKNYNSRLVFSLAGVGIFIILWCIYGTGLNIWYRLIPGSTLTSNVGKSHEFGWKLQGYKNFIDGFKFFGNGYKQIALINPASIVHNVPLVIVQQLGIVPAISWIVASVKSWKWNYLWVGIGLMCLLDHMIWTNFAIYWWAIVGLSNKKDGVL